MRRKGGRSKGEEDEERELSRQELERVIRKLDDGKSTGGMTL